MQPLNCQNVNVRHYISRAILILSIFLSSKSASLQLNIGISAVSRLFRNTPICSKLGLCREPLHFKQLILYQLLATPGYLPCLTRTHPREALNFNTQQTRVWINVRVGNAKTKIVLKIGLRLRDSRTLVWTRRNLKIKNARVTKLHYIF